MILDRVTTIAEDLAELKKTAARVDNINRIEGRLLAQVNIGDHVSACEVAPTGECSSDPDPDTQTRFAQRTTFYSQKADFPGCVENGNCRDGSIYLSFELLRAEMRKGRELFSMLATSFITSAQSLLPIKRRAHLSNITVNQNEYAYVLRFSLQTEQSPSIPMELQYTSKRGSPFNLLPYPIPHLMKADIAATQRMADQISRFTSATPIPIMGVLKALSQSYGSHSYVSSCLTLNYSVDLWKEMLHYENLRLGKTRGRYLSMESNR